MEAAAVGLFVVFLFALPLVLIAGTVSLVLRLTGAPAERRRLQTLEEAVRGLRGEIATLRTRLSQLERGWVTPAPARPAAPPDSRRSAPVAGPAAEPEAGAGALPAGPVPAGSVPTGSVSSGTVSSGSVSSGSVSTSVSSGSMSTSVSSGSMSTSVSSGSVSAGPVSAGLVSTGSVPPSEPFHPAASAGRAADDAVALQRLAQSATDRPAERATDSAIESATATAASGAHPEAATVSPAAAFGRGAVVTPSGAAARPSDVDSGSASHARASAQPSSASAGSPIPSVDDAPASGDLVLASGDLVLSSGGAVLAPGGLVLTSGGAVLVPGAVLAPGGAASPSGDFASASAASADAASADAADAAGDPGSATGDPGSATGDPGSATGDPGSATGDPGSATGDPGSAAGDPGSATGDPASAGEPTPPASGAPTPASDDARCAGGSAADEAASPVIDWEQWIGVRGAAALGATILVLAGIYFFEYSVEHGLITPAGRMVAGTLVGLGCLLGTELRLRREHPVLANWLAGAGVGILYVAFWAGHAVYELYPSSAAGALLVGTTGACVALAVRHRSAAIATLGLFGGFVTPLALSSGADRPIPLFAYLLLLDAALLWVAYRRRWSWMALLCLGATAFYEGGWLLGRLDEPRLWIGTSIGIVFAALFAAIPRRRSEANDRASAGEPSADEPSVGGPPVGGPSVGGPTVGGPSVGGPSVDAPSVGGPSIGGPSVDAPSVDAPSVDGPSVDAPSVDGPSIDGPSVDEEDWIWKLTRAVAVLLPLLFTMVTAGRTDLGEHFWATATQIVLLCVAAGWIGLRHGSHALPTGAALAAAGALLSWGTTHPPQVAAQVWQLVGLALTVSAVFHASAHLARRRGQTAAAASPAIVYDAAALVLAASCAPWLDAGGPWPWLSVWSALLVAGALLPTAGRRGASLGAARGLLVGAGLGGVLVVQAGREGQPSGVLLLGLAVAAAALAQLLGLTPASAQRRRSGDWAAGAVAALLLGFVAFVGRAADVPTAALHAAALVLAVLVLLVALRRRSTGWGLAALLLTGATQSALVWRFGAGALELGALSVSFCSFSLSPLVAPAELRDRPWAWRTAALSGLCFFPAARAAYLEVLGPSTIGLLPIALAAVSLGAAYAVRARGPRAAEARRVATVWLVAAAAGALTVAVPLQLENEWLTIGWAGLCLTYTLLWRRLDHAGLKYLALGLGTAVCARLLANPYVLEYGTTSGTPLLGWLAYTYLVPAACLFGAWAAMRAREVARRRLWERSMFSDGRATAAQLMAAAGFAVVFAYLNLAIFDWFAQGPRLSIPTDRLPARDLSLSLAWAAYALVMLGCGMLRRSTALRATSLALILATSGKVFLYDLAHLTDLYRVASLVGLAACLILVSFGYRRFVFRAARAEEAS